jgi:hypothetical protein
VAQKILLLLSTGINFEAKNLESKTALDIASTPKIKGILLRAGAKSRIEVADAPTLAHRLRSKTTTMYKLLIQTIRIRSDMTEEQRNIWLIVAALIATTMYESALTPPGGVYPSSAGDNSLNIDSSNSTISSTQGNVGKSVLSEAIFCLFAVSNMLSFFISTTTIIIMTSSVMQCTVVYMLMYWFSLCYMISMLKISPTYASAIIAKIPFVVFLSVPFVCVIFLFVYSQLQHERNAKKHNRS